MIAKMYSVYKRLIVNIRDYGLISTMKLMWMLLSNMMYMDNKNYEFVLLAAAKRGEDYKLTKNQLVITWFIPDFGIGSGGHTTIFRIANLLNKFGYISNIVIIPPTKFTDTEQIKRVVTEHFVTEFNGNFLFWGDDLPECDIVFATSWETAYYVNAVEGDMSRFYFIQDFEPDFYCMSSQYVFAENTYRLGFKCLCASPWLAEMMSIKYGAKSASFELAYTPLQYYPLGIPRSPKTVIFYARHLTPRRGFELGILALQILKQKDPDVEVILFGATAYPGIPFPCKCCGILSHVDLLHLYNSATVGLVISLTNYSLVPNEMMACKLPVVDMNTDCMASIYKNNENIVLATPEPFAIALSLIELINDESKRKYIATNAYNRVSELTWDRTAECIDKTIRTL